VSSSLSLLLAAEAVELVLIAALAIQWLRGRRNREQLLRQRAGANARTGALVHELNQPLTAILSNAQAAQRFLASDRLDLQELREILDDIVTEDKRAAGIVRHIGGILQDTAAGSAGSSGAPPAEDQSSGVKSGAPEGKERGP
jgi:signal transduction histidine kinase